MLQNENQPLACHILSRKSIGVCAMIKVAARNENRAVVEELFELFKTPWDFYEPPGDPSDVLLCFDGSCQLGLAQMVLHFSSEPTESDQQLGIKSSPNRQPPMLKCHDQTIPIYGASLALQCPESEQLLTYVGGGSAALRVNSHGRTIIRVGFDFLGELRHLLVAGQPPENAHLPALDGHLSLLRCLVLCSGTPLVEIPPVPQGFNFLACLTHDVDHVGVRNHRFDHTMFGFAYRATLGTLIEFITRRKSAAQLFQNWLAAFKLPLVHLGLARDFWYQFDHYRELEAGHPSTFFFVPFKDQPGHEVGIPKTARRATRYDVTDIPTHVRQLADAGCEIGLHGIEAWRDAQSGSIESDRIASVSGCKPLGVRMHWLCFNEKSPARLEEAGFAYDSSFGYNGAIGYRAGTTQVYKPLGVQRLLELPLHVMDTALFYPAHLDLSPVEARHAVELLLKHVMRAGGCLTLNWHDRSLAPERLWGDFYAELLANLQQRGAWLCTGAQAVAWFQMRRQARLTAVSSGDRTVSGKISAVLDPALPGLRLRVYGPLTAPFGESIGLVPEVSFVDAPLSSQGEFHFAV